MRNEKISFSKLKLTNNKQLPTGHPQNQVRTFSFKFYFQSVVYYSDDIDT